MLAVCNQSSEFKETGPRSTLEQTFGKGGLQPRTNHILVSSFGAGIRGSWSIYIGADGMMLSFRQYDWSAHQGYILVLEDSFALSSPAR